MGVPPPRKSTQTSPVFSSVGGVFTSTRRVESTVSPQDPSPSEVFVVNIDPSFKSPFQDTSTLN